RVTGSIRIQVLARRDGDRRSVEVFAAGEGGAWSRLSRASAIAAGAVAPAIDRAAIATRLAPAAIDGFYDRLRARGLDYGPAFRGVVDLRVGAGEALGCIAA